jgi:hypothetical protein
LLCALEVELVCVLEQTKKLETVPLSNDTKRCGRVAVSFKALKNVIEELVASQFPFKVQLDETANVSQCSLFRPFLFRYVHADAVKGEFLFREPHLETT